MLAVNLSQVSTDFIKSQGKNKTSSTYHGRLSDSVIWGLKMKQFS